MAIFLNNKQLIKLFFENGFEVDKVDHGKTSLHLALELSTAEITKLLIQHGASLGIRDENGNTALEITCKPPAPPVNIKQETEKLKMFKQIVHLGSNL